MKKIIIYTAYVVMAFTACKDKKVPCPYQVGETCMSLDENLYVSYEINSEKYTYYMGGPGGGNFNYAFSTMSDNGKYAQVKALFCGFDELYQGNRLDHPCSYFNLTFINYEVVKDGTPPFLNDYRLHEVLKVADYKFSSINDFSIPGISTPLADTLFMMDGVSMKIGNNSTANIIKYYDKDYNKIYSDVLNITNSYLRITSMEQVCDSYYLIKGEFSTKLMNDFLNGEMEIIEVKNGKFQFLIY